MKFQFQWSFSQVFSRVLVAIKRGSSSRCFRETNKRKSIRDRNRLLSEVHRSLALIKLTNAAYSKNERILIFSSVYVGRMKNRVCVSASESASELFRTSRAGRRPTNSCWLEESLWSAPSSTVTLSVPHRKVENPESRAMFGPS